MRLKAQMAKLARFDLVNKASMQEVYEESSVPEPLQAFLRPVSRVCIRSLPRNPKGLRQWCNANESLLLAE